VNAEDPREPGDLFEGQNLVLELIARGESLSQVLDTLLRIIQLQCPGMLASILLLEPDGIHVRHGAAPDLPEDYVRAIDGLPIGPQAGSCGTAAFTRKPVIVGDIATDPLWSDYRAKALKHDLRACWSTPIFDSERRVLGTFAMYFRAPGLPNQRHLRLIDISTNIAAIAITKHRAEEEIRRTRALG
jgi:GAF domain-containing protein